MCRVTSQHGCVAHASVHQHECQAFVGFKCFAHGGQAACLIAFCFCLTLPGVVWLLKRPLDWVVDKLCPHIFYFLFHYLIVSWEHTSPRLWVGVENTRRMCWSSTEAYVSASLVALVWSPWAYAPSSPSPCRRVVTCVGALVFRRVSEGCTLRAKIHWLVIVSNTLQGASRVFLFGLVAHVKDSTLFFTLLLLSFYTMHFRLLVMLFLCCITLNLQTADKPNKQKAT